MIREPELVAIEDLVQHSNEVVSIEGTVVSWVEDPYSSGENRVNILIEDDTGVAQLGWYNFAEIPMLGTTIKVTGDVIVYNGKIWIQAIGSGAVSWDDADIPDATRTYDINNSKISRGLPRRNNYCYRIYLKAGQSGFYIHIFDSTRPSNIWNARISNEHDYSFSHH